MKRILLILLLIPSIAFAQPSNQLNDSSVFTISQMTVLQDKGYPLEKILADTALPFTPNDRPIKDDYWLKVIVDNPFPETRPYVFHCNPSLDNTIWYYDANDRNWLHQQGGILAKPSNGLIDRTALPFLLRANTRNILYIHVHASGYAIQPTATITKGETAQRADRIGWVSWLILISVLLLFILNNAYIYFHLGDKIVLYFLIIQAGALLYVTGYKRVINILLPNPVFSIAYHGNMQMEYEANSILLHLSIIVCMYGLTQFTRSYFNTRRHFPAIDKLLRYSLFIFLPVSLALTIVNTGWYLENYTWHFDNGFCAIQILAIIGVSILSYKRRLPAARAFLVAYILPFIFMLGTALFHLITPNNSTAYTIQLSFLPDLAIITQSIAFSVALVTRTRLLEQDLILKETEAAQLQAQLNQMELRHQLITRENEMIQTEMHDQKNLNEALNQKMEANQRELASISLYIAQKNELLAQLKTQIKDVKKQSSPQQTAQLKDIESLLQSNTHLDDDWTKFRLHFERVHPGFFENLKASHPNLTRNEVRLSAYFHINLSTKEIATLLNIDPASVRRAKTRLYKKLGIAQEPEV